MRSNFGPTLRFSELAMMSSARGVTELRGGPFEPLENRGADTASGNHDATTSRALRDAKPTVTVVPALNAR